MVTKTRDDDGAKPEKAGGAKTAEKKSRTSPLLFYRQVVTELRKVKWPTRRELLVYTLVVLIFVLVMVGFVTVIDIAFGELVTIVFG
ncbi:preprotein translocase subunit SecE [Allonocardiopsis opalescens]|uniref:Protein translocase subunit SecE n=1 Tax=Allonocardiopsis opalescens TaxID=1144618 RepID=A0A2T0Q7Y1_9ACTN|nr:preprotein translocase subunit SecE [Allonocardiopsis opalescens]PRX99957.1 preprotein translocase subunit SecE [Allonocardiopsis opalescens]